MANVLQAGGSGFGGRGGRGAGVHAAFHLFQAHVPFVSGAVHAAGVLYETHGGGGGGRGGGCTGMLQRDEFQKQGFTHFALSLMAGHGGGAGPTR
eukprot:SAG11_NODE_594_length_8302_cov_1.386810_10_plen_95_part_00